MVTNKVDYSFLASETVAKIDIYPFSQEFLVMELYAKNRVDSSRINSVSVKKRLREEDDSRDKHDRYSLHNKFQEISQLSIKDRDNLPKTTGDRKLSLVDTICAPPHIIGLEPNLLEQNYQPESLWFERKAFKARILLIEHQDNSRNLIASMLRAKNFRVIEAKDSNAALNLAKSEYPDLIICELMMPIIDGYGILHLLRQSKITNRIPLLFITVDLTKDREYPRLILVKDRNNIEPLTAENLLTEIDRYLNLAISKL